MTLKKENISETNRYRRALVEHLRGLEIWNLFYRSSEKCFPCYGFHMTPVKL